MFQQDENSSDVFVSVCLRHARAYLAKGPHRIGRVYKKAVFREYTDASYTHLAPRPAWLGLLGPIIKAEVNDTLTVHLKNFASTAYSLHPHGVFYEKDSEGTQRFTQKHRIRGRSCGDTLLSAVSTLSCTPQGLDQPGWLVASAASTLPAGLKKTHAVMQNDALNENTNIKMWKSFQYLLNYVLKYKIKAL